MRTYILLAVLLLCFTSKSFSNLTTSKQQDTLKNGKGFILFSKSADIDRVDFDKNKKSKNKLVYVHFGFPKPMPTSNTISGTVLQSNRKYTEDGSLPVFDKIDILKGKYADIKVEKESNFKNLFTLSNVEFPLRLKLFSGKEMIDLEVIEDGEWNISIDLKNN